jgi:PAS domain-containing protein
MCVRDPAGKVLRWTGSATYVTEQKRAEAALLESEQRYERAMLAADAGLWEWDVAKDEFYVSHRACSRWPVSRLAPDSPVARTSCVARRSIRRTATSGTRR